MPARRPPRPPTVTLGTAPLSATPGWAIVPEPPSYPAQVRTPSHYTIRAGSAGAHDEHGPIAAVLNGCPCFACLASGRRGQRVVELVGQAQEGALRTDATWHCAHCDVPHDWRVYICMLCGVCSEYDGCRRCFTCDIMIPTGQQCRQDAACTEDRHCTACCSTVGYVVEEDRSADPDARFGSTPASPPVAPAEWLRFSHNYAGRVRGRAERPSPSYLTSYGRGLTSSRAEHRAFPSQRTIGAEIEVCGAKAGDYRHLECVNRFWGAHTQGDGSLPGGGTEVVTVPAQGNYYVRQIIDICDALTRDKAWVNTRAGLHIHIGLYDPRCPLATDGHRKHAPSGCHCYSWADLRRLILLWEMIEPAMFYAVSEDRRNNSYCVPVRAQLADLVRAHRDPAAFKVAIQEKYWRFRRTDLKGAGRPPNGAPQYVHCPECLRPLAPVPPGLGSTTSAAAINYLSTVLRGKFLKCLRPTCGWVNAVGPQEARYWKAKKRDKSGANRYLAMNFHSWVHRGTVECRMHQGTIDAGEILRWSRLLARICDTAMRRTEKEILAEAAGLTDTASRFPALERIAAETRDEAFCRWLHDRLESNQAAALAAPLPPTTAFVCPFCTSTRYLSSEPSVPREFTHWCRCNCGRNVYYNAQTGRTAPG